MDRDRSRPTASHLISSPSLLNEEWQPWYDIAGGRAIPIFPADGGASSQITKEDPHDRPTQAVGLSSGEDSFNLERFNKPGRVPELSWPSTGLE
ncbi:hypothetical protein ASPCAL10774 [Aspergillus calidoustus]|uniref:Uncharacterized protein n=1 Tax=Aspergillus calidoustus TaxID=454130 RepID=A0A0U5G6Q7_ASPCI|nr:hypothetical protein ASPCAL10774 [Aspergillus calidoustus]